MRAGLFDILTGEFHDGSLLKQTHVEDYTLKSVLGNLDRLFNARHGELYHLPDFGLPDTSSAYSDFPASVEMLRRSIREAIEAYEPRLRRVSVQSSLDEVHLRKVTFILRAELINVGRIQLRTSFRGSRLIEIEPIKQ
jgi:type VI secretion system protein